MQVSLGKTEGAHQSPIEKTKFSFFAIFVNPRLYSEERIGNGRGVNLRSWLCGKVGGIDGVPNRSEGGGPNGILRGVVVGL